MQAGALELITRGDTTFQVRAFNLDRAAEGVVVFMPSIVSDQARARGLIPYFPRLQWAEDYGCTVYVADPLPLEAGGGSWFLHPERGSVLPDVVDLIRRDLGVGDAPVVYAGSSMGGYAALVLAALDPLGAGYAEMPQTVLAQYHGSAAALRHFTAINPDFTTEHRRWCDLTAEPFKRAKFVCRTRLSDTWHMRLHSLPLAQALAGSACEATFSFETPDDGLTGHQAFSRESARDAILKLL